MQPTLPAESPSSDSPLSTLDDKLLSTSELLAYLGVSRPTLSCWIQRGNFPPPIQCSPRRFAWRASEVEQWLHRRPRG